MKIWTVNGEFVTDGAGEEVYEHYRLPACKDSHTAPMENIEEYASRMGEVIEVLDGAVSRYEPYRKEPHWTNRAEEFGSYKE